MVRIEVNYKPASDTKVRGKNRRSSSPNSSTMHFSWDNLSPKLVITSKSPDFDPISISHWREEGFAVTYLPCDDDAKAFRSKLSHLAEPLELGDKYAIVGTVLSG